MACFLKQSTAVEIKLGPFLDEDDGKTAETSLTIEDEHVGLAKNGGDWGDKNETTTCVHESQGWYRCLLNTTDTDTLGVLIVKVHVAGALPVWREFMVVSANFFDSMFGSGKLQVVLHADGLTAVNAEMVDALATDTYAEPGQGNPLATTSLAAKINYLYKAWRNRHTQTASEYALYAANTTTKDQQATVGDDGTTFDRGQVGTGA